MPVLTLLTTLLPALIQAGGLLTQALPQLAPAINAVTTGVQPPAAQPNLCALIQELLNSLQAAGVVAFGPPLRVDGHFGALTFAAIEAMQTKMGLVVPTQFALIEQAILADVFAKL